MKTGTTWINDYLALRGDVCLPKAVKETFYFDRYYGRGSSWYHHHFRHFDPLRHKAVVEVAPSLFHCPQSPSRIRDELGMVPIIVTYRDPVARSWSHYTHLRRYGYTRKPLADAVDEFPQIIAASRYQERLDYWREHLPDSSITILELDKLRADPDAYVHALCDALAIDPVPIPPGLESESNKAAVPPSFLAARLGRVLSYRLRALGFYNVVNAAKAMGLHRLFFGSGDNSAPLAPTPEEERLLAQKLGVSLDR